MGSKVFWFEECPKCGKETFENFEHISSLIKMADCQECGYEEFWDVIEKGNRIEVKKRKVK